MWVMWVFVATHIHAYKRSPSVCVAAQIGWWYRLSWVANIKYQLSFVLLLWNWHFHPDMTVTKLLSMMEVPFLNIEDVHVQRSLTNGGQIVDSIPCLQHSKASILQEAGITTELLSPSSEKRIEDIVTLVNARPFWMEFGVFSSGLMKKDVLNVS